MKKNMMRFSGVALVIASAMLASCAGYAEPKAASVTSAEPISIHGNITVFEIAPVLLAARDYYPGVATVKMGGIPNLVGAAQIPGFGSEGVADAATHAETQALRYSVKNENIRIIMNVTQGLYRIVARKSAGINSVADLKGKKIATIPTTSSGYFLHKMLAREGLSYADITPVMVSPLTDMPKALADRRVDAVVIWEPESENAAQVLGTDIVQFEGKGIYAEQFNLNSIAENLADPVKRAKIVRFVRAVIDAAAQVRRDPSEAKKLFATIGKHPPEQVERSWKHHAFNADYPANMLDILVEEEKWLATQDKRTARTREQLSKLIDRSVYEEALALKVAR